MPEFRFHQDYAQDLWEGDPTKPRNKKAGILRVVDFVWSPDGTQVSVVIETVGADRQRKKRTFKEGDEFLVLISEYPVERRICRVTKLAFGDGGRFFADVSIT